MLKEWTVKQLEEYGAKNPGFSFYTDQHPSLRIRAGRLMDAVRDLLTEDQRHELNKRTIDFRSGFYLTTNAVVALALLHAPAWMSVTPGEWAHEQEPEPEKPKKKTKAKAANE